MNTEQQIAQLREKMAIERQMREEMKGWTDSAYAELAEIALELNAGSQS